ncbi:hypothetical protein [Streptomyces sp. NPDC001536]
MTESGGGSPTYTPLDTSAEASVTTRHVVTVDLNDDGAQDAVAATSKRLR